MRDRYEAPQILIGQSLGGTAVLVAAPRVAESRAVVTIGAPSDTQHLRDTLIRLNPELAEEHEAEVTLGGQTFRVRKQLLEDLDEQNVREMIADVDRALLVFHSPVDRIVGIAHARRIFDAAEHPKSFVSLDGADHLLLKRRDAMHVAEVLAAWVRRYVRRPAAD